MLWQEFFIAVALVMVWEGLLPAINPQLFRQFIASMLTLDDTRLRQFGIISMACGAIFLYLIKH